MIFETQRLRIRNLVLSDLKPFHEMQSNPNVMQFADGEVKTLEEHHIELNELIKKYDNIDNDFWIYAIERKLDAKFVGTLALVKDGEDDEIGYRFLEIYWNKGYGFEVCEATVEYCKHKGLKQLTAYCVDDNIASAKILEKLNFQAIQHFIRDDTSFPETKYKLNL